MAKVASDGVEMVIGVGGYGNLGSASLAALPSTASITALRSQATASFQQEKQCESIIELEKSRVEDNAALLSSATGIPDPPRKLQKLQRVSVIEVETSRVDNNDGRQKNEPTRSKRVRGESRSELPAAREIRKSELGSKSRRRSRADHSPPAESDRARRKRQPAFKPRTLEQDAVDVSAIPGKQVQRKSGPPLSLASLAASAAAVAVSGSGVSIDNMRCVTVRIGGVEVQVPMIARGARPQSRPAKSASELEADMHSLVLGWDIANAAEVEDSDQCGVGFGGVGALKQVPVRFGSADEYEDSIAPLLMHECLQQVRLQAICS